MKIDHTLWTGRTINAPPPPTSTQNATNFLFAAMKEPSKAQFVVRNPSYQVSFFVGSDANTCLNLDDRTIAIFMTFK